MIQSNPPEHHPFEDFLDLASEGIGAEVLMANDEFFAEKENLIKESNPLFIPDKFTERGKWMDGWETRRNRDPEPKKDWAVIRLGAPGVIAGVDVDTAHFVGNFPEACSIEASNSLEASEWTEILPRTALGGGAHHYLAIEDSREWAFVRLNIFPDGGVARLRVYGKVQFVFDGSEVDLLGARQGGKALLCSDSFFSAMDHLIMPFPGKNMGDGWETRRRRGPGHDWMILRMGTRGQIQRVVVDTAYFKGNFPDSVSIEACLIDGDPLTATEIVTRTPGWTEILPPQKLKGDQEHEFQIRSADRFNYVRVNIYPDGGLSRLRLMGVPA